MIAVIGDIHGCYHTLVKLFEEIKTKYPGIPIYSVGDLVDRGSFSYEVVEFVKQNDIKFTAGNHDLMFYYFITQPNHPVGKPWVYNGSETTLESYDHNTTKMREHLAFIIKAPLFFNLKDCFISHAGISSYYHKNFKNSILNKTEELEELLNQDLNSMHSVLWTRDKLLNLDKLQIVGHTIFQEVRHDKKSDALYIDTSAFAGNKLSAVIIEKNKLVESLSIETVPVDIA
jgi:serine/threonine protein phosphatase 1